MCLVAGQSWSCTMCMPYVRGQPSITWADITTFGNRIPTGGITTVVMPIRLLYLCTYIHTTYLLPHILRPQNRYLRQVLLSTYKYSTCIWLLQSVSYTCFAYIPYRTDYKQHWSFVCLSFACVLYLKKGQSSLRRRNKNAFDPNSKLTIFWVELNHYDWVSLNFLK